MERRDQIIVAHPVFFDSKPMIVKPWDPNVDLVREKIRTLPIQIEMHLDFKDYGEQCLHKIASHVGKLIKLDQATKKRDKLQYARMMIEVKLDMEFPEEISFYKNNNKVLGVKVEYDWKPTQCATYKGMGHRALECRNPVARHVWMPKVHDKQGETQKNDENNDRQAGNMQEFQPMRNPARRIILSSSPAVVQNNF